MKKINLKKHDPNSTFSNKKKVIQALSEAIIEGDNEAVQDILYGFLSYQNKQQLAHDTQLSRSTIYNAFKGNPSLKTLVEIFKKAS